MKQYMPDPRLSLLPLRPRYAGHQREDSSAQLEIDKELTILREWSRVQKDLLDYIFAPPAETVSSWRKRIEEGIYQSTCGQAQIWWEPLPRACLLGSGLLIELYHMQTRYGVLKLTPGYLISHLAPDIHQAFGQLCSMLISFTEYQTLVHLLLKPLAPLEIYDSLTTREKEVLQGMAIGESEQDIAQRLNIALSTVRTHRHNVYRNLDVHNSQEAILRSFALRIIDWLDLCNSTPDVAASDAFNTNL